MLMILLANGCAKHRVTQKPVVLAPQLPAVELCARRAGIVFVGTLTRGDFRWSCTSGIAECLRALDFRVEKVLKGGARNSVRIEVIMLGVGLWKDGDEEHRVRLARRFFAEGQQYVVLADSPTPQTAIPRDEFVVISDEQIWPALPENVKIVERLIRINEGRTDRK